MLLRDLEVLQHGFVGKSCAQQQRGCSLVLNIERRVGIRQRCILGVRNDEILGCNQVRVKYHRRITRDKNLPSGTVKTTQFFKKAIAIA